LAGAFFFGLRQCRAIIDQALLHPAYRGHVTRARGQLRWAFGRQAALWGHVALRDLCTGGRTVLRLLFEIEIAPGGVEFTKKADQILQRSAKPVDGNDVNLVFGSVSDDAKIYFRLTKDVILREIGRQDQGDIGADFFKV